MEQFKKKKENYEFPSKKGKNAGIAFISGGCIGVFGQGIYHLYVDVFRLTVEQANAYMIMTIIFITAVLTGLGWFDKIAQICGAGTFIPISGFANALVSSAMEGRSEGPIFGVGSNMFKLAGSVLTYGVSTAIIVAMIRLWIGL